MLSASTPSLLRVDNLVVRYGEGKKEFTAVKGVNFELGEGETLGLVGESGCGKTSTGMAIARLIPIGSGKVLVDGEDVSQMGTREFLPYRRRIQFIFQNPESSLNPRLTIRSSLREALELGSPKDKANWDNLAAEALVRVGLDPDYATRFPHELSGGQLQRVGIARALCVKPKLLICDEPVSSLDVSIQAQILNLLMDLQANLGLSYLFISHDLRVVGHISRRVAVMRNGAILETGTVQEVFQNPGHSYTRQLIDSIPGGGFSA